MSSSTAGRRAADADQMTSTVLVNALLEIGLDNVVGDRTAFINVTRNFLVNDTEVPLNPGRTVLEILEHISPDDEVIAGATRLRAEGFRIALDDFVYTEESARLLEVADIVKIDLLAMSADAVAQLVARCRQWPYSWWRPRHGDLRDRLSVRRVAGRADGGVRGSGCRQAQLCPARH
jgi:EAL and modified HD-GYP domain-containing signal transduction protein